MTEVLQCSSKFNIRSDEEEIECIEGCKLAKVMMSELERHKPESRWKELVTPLHFKFSNELKDLNRQKRRTRDSVQEQSMINQSILQIKETQLKFITESMECFIRIIVLNVQNKNRLVFFIEWLNLLLDKQSRCLMPTVRGYYNQRWDELKKLKNDGATENDIKPQAKLVKLAEKYIEDASFGLEHMFREMAHIFEAYKEITKLPQHVNIPEPAVLSKAVAQLLTYGYSFELIDGDSSYINVDWVRSILKDVEYLTRSKRVLILSVLGVQSSGKSTLLNTMFGLQFAVSAGRCTRGVYAHLLPTPNSKSFDHIMIVDSEGLRAPELREKHRNHDNELATFVLGLGNITLLNIKGENTNEIHDILQIVIHAFLRLRLANKELDTGRKCVFVHQNVAPISANKLKYSLQKLVEQLDEMTLEAANSERISNVTAFNQVIAFNENEHVFHIPDLWKGDPPMAATNIGYVNAVADLRTQVTKVTKYVKIGNISHQIIDLWNGILSEDFVFSFKNSLEIKANLLMEEICKDMAWKLEKHIRSFLQKESEKVFNKLNTENEVDIKFEILKKKLTNELDQKNREISCKLEEFFKHNDYKDIIINWKENQLNRFRQLAIELEMEIVREIQTLGNKRKCTIKMHLSQAEHDSKLYIASFKLAQDLKGKQCSEENIAKRFEEIWKQYINGIKRTESANFSFRDIFMKRLRERHFIADHAILVDVSSQYENQFASLNLQKLHGSYTQLELVKDDLNIKQMSIFNQVRGFLGRTYEKAINELEDRIESFFHFLDNTISQNKNEYNELNVVHVHALLQEIETWTNNFKIEKGPYTITASKVFKAKIFWYISYHAINVFQLHNAEVRQQHIIDSDTNLETYKRKVKERFNGYLKNRSAEITAAVGFREGMEEFVGRTVLNHMSFKVECEMNDKLPSSKYSIIITILTDLVLKNSFKDFMSYIQDPHGCMIEYVTEIVNDLLFKADKYFELANGEIKYLINDIENAIKTARVCIEERNHAGKLTNIDDWVKLLCDNVSKCTIENEIFKGIKQENVTDFNNFSKHLENQLKIARVNIESKFRSVDQNSVKWYGSNPILKFSKKVWGCEESCVYCGEPCSKGYKHAFDHHCVQHRPTCVMGTREEGTDEASEESCNFLVQSDIKHYCSVCQFLCNRDEKKDCEEKLHPYRTYKKLLTDWLIDPNPNMEETSKYWMWFIVKYKTELKEHYEYTLDHIPEDWNTITQQDALDSLTVYYGTKSE